MIKATRDSYRTGLIMDVLAISNGISQRQLAQASMRVDKIGIEPRSTLGNLESSKQLVVASPHARLTRLER
jgi:hypothetical protein